MEVLAQALGRRKANRGKEPCWVITVFPELPPLSIPHHGGGDLKKGTKNSIVNQLEDDLLAWEELLEEQHETGEEGQEE